MRNLPFSRGLAALCLIALAASRAGAISILTDNRNVTLVGSPNVVSTPSAPLAAFNSTLLGGRVNASQISSLSPTLFQASGSIYGNEGPGLIATYTTASSLFDLTFRVDTTTAFDLWTYREFMFWGGNEITLKRSDGLVIASRAGATSGDIPNVIDTKGYLNPGIYEMKITTAVTASSNFPFYDETHGRFTMTLAFTDPAAVPDGGSAVGLLAVTLMALAFLAHHRRMNRNRAGA